MSFVIFKAEHWARCKLHTINQFIEGRHGQSNGLLKQLMVAAVRCTAQQAQRSIAKQGNQGDANELRSSQCSPAVLC